MIDGFDPDKFRKVNKDSKNYDTGIHVERQFNSSASSTGSSSTRYVYRVEECHKKSFQHLKNNFHVYRESLPICKFHYCDFSKYLAYAFLHLPWPKIAKKLQ